MIEGCPVVGFTGPNGVGKTLVAVTECITDMRAGRTVVSTVPIECRWGKSVPLVSLRQLVELEHCTVLVDEVGAVFPSRGTQGLPDEVQIFLQTMRHRDVTVRWTAPAWMRADTMLRSATQVAVGVFGLGKVKKKGVFWPRPLLIGAGAMDVVGIAQDAPPEKVLKRRVYIPQRLAGWGAYDTMADVPRIGRPATGSACVDCGGTTRRAACTPERHADLGLPAPVDEIERMRAVLAQRTADEPETAPEDSLGGSDDAAEPDGEVAAA